MAKAPKKQTNTAKPSKANSKANKGSAQKSRKQSGGMWTHIMVAGLVLMSIVFMSSAVILFIGLLPMFVAFFVDKRKKKTKAITVGAMNIAGCVPFVMELWTGAPSMEKALTIILDPMAIIVIYAAAGIGYLIDWAVTLLVAGFMYQRGVARKEAILKRQKELVERWGEEVTGKMVLDPEGFPIESGDKASEAEITDGLLNT